MSSLCSSKIFLRTPDRKLKHVILSLVRDASRLLYAQFAAQHSSPAMVDRTVCERRCRA